MKKLIVIPLGTVSPYCKQNMNCPCFLIKYENNNILLDCGNGITRLMNFPTDLDNLHVFVSHFHKDHYGDLGAIQYASFVYHNLGVTKQPIKIYLPENDFNFSKQEILSNNEAYANYYDISEGKEYIIGDLKVSFHNNNSHTIETFTIKVETADFKVVYTSDVGNTNIEGLAKFCNNADLLICESSFLKKHNSNSKTHLTAYDAANIAKQANVKKLLLTHFWPEENKKEYLREAKSVYKRTKVAKEGKKIVLRS
ncbi:MAG: MBL fold metallo-hydrolase [Clostridiales bacterium]|nr:MBL fold metallo-hydrolase [Clostridiales bacterium]